jgi:hypothetical protein
MSRSLISGKGKKFLFSKASKSALVLTQLPVLGLFPHG